jgi:xanthine dehydrogenase iron-sulfur cluster and FAD-binding subunit A
MMALIELWPDRGTVSREQLDEVLAGQLCRCTGYVGTRHAAYAAFGIVAGP